MNGKTIIPQILQDVMNNVIITGGAGFIGSNFLHLAVKEDWFDEILVIDKLNIGSNIANIPASEKIKFDKRDLRDIKDEELVYFSSIINFGAETHVDRSIDNSLNFSESNYLSVHYLLEKIRKTDSDIKFLQISTDEVYGSILEGVFDENSNFNPRNPYSATKAAAELLLNAYHITYGLKTITTRSSNNYGPRQYKEKYLPKMITNFLSGKPIGIYGSGNQIRDWTHVEDNCRAIKIVFDNGVPGNVYNISANCEKTNNEMADLVAKLMKVNFEYKQYIDDRLGHDFRYAIDTSKVRDLGWKPQVNLDEGLSDTISWYKNQKSV